MSILTALIPALNFSCGPPDTDQVDTSELLPESIGDWSKEDSPVIYDRETIFDYINGAGEVYRSYAFNEVAVVRYENPEGLGLTVEVFDMGNPEDAYGVFSYAREEEEPGIGAAYESRGSILCFWQDRFYVCVAAEQRDPDPGPMLEAVARGVSGALPLPGPRPTLVDALPPEGLRSLSERFFHLHQTLNYHYYLVRENVLDLSGDTDAVLGRYQPGSAILLIVRYGGEGPASDALVSFRHLVTRDHVSAETSQSDIDAQTLRTGNWNFVSSVRRGPYAVIALNGETAAEVETLVDSALENLALLARE